MLIECRKCGKILRTDDEVRYTAIGYYRELGSKRVFSVSKPHDVEPDSLEHVDCTPGD
jgi:hypothetical protein